MKETHIAKNKDGQSVARYETHGERAHARVSPSSLKLFEISPGYVREESEPHPVTLQGTKLHEILDGTRSIKDIKDDPESLELCRKCKLYVDHVMSSGNYARHDEVKLYMTGDVYGFADVILEGQHEAHLIDYKFGFHSQEPVETNPAAQAYVLGIFNLWPRIDTVYVHYIYPRRDEIDRTEYRRSADEDKIRLRVETIAARANKALEVYKDDPTAVGYCNPSTETCKYCARKSVCGDIKKLALPIATAYGAARQLPTSGTIVDPHAVDDPEQMRRLLNAASILERWSKSVKKAAHDMVFDQGKTIPGYVMREKRGKRSIVDAIPVARDLQELGATSDQILGCVDFKLGAVEDLIKLCSKKGHGAKTIRKLFGQWTDIGAVEEAEASDYLFPAPDGVGAIKDGTNKP